MGRLAGSVVGILLILVQAGHASEPALPANALKVPITHQNRSYSCGAASLLSILYYWGEWDGREDWLRKLLGTNKDLGTPAKRIVAEARRRRLTAEIEDRSTFRRLRELIAEGETVIVDYQAWAGVPYTPDTWDHGHYSVAVGVDEGYLYLMDPLAHRGYGYIPIEEFKTRWRDWEWDDNHQRSDIVRRLIRIRGNPAKAATGLIRTE